MKNKTRPQKKKEYLTLEQKHEKMMLGSNQRAGNIFKFPPSRQSERLQNLLNQEK